MARHADYHERTAHPAAVPKLANTSGSGFGVTNRASDVRGA